MNIDENPFEPDTDDLGKSRLANKQCAYCGYVLKQTGRDHWKCLFCKASYFVRILTSEEIAAMPTMDVVMGYGTLSPDCKFSASVDEDAAFLRSCNIKGDG